MRVFRNGGLRYSEAKKMNERVWSRYDVVGFSVYGEASDLAHAKKMVERLKAEMPFAQYIKFMAGDEQVVAKKEHGRWVQ